MEFSAGQIADILEGNVEGDKEVKVSQLAKIEEGEAGCLTFLANPQYEDYLYQTRSSIAIVNADFKAAKPAPQATPRGEVSALDQEKSNRDAKADYNRLKAGLDGCHSVEMLDQWVVAWKDDLDALPEDHAGSLRGEYKRKRDGLKVKEAA